MVLGLTDFGCKLNGDIFAFTPIRAGARIERDRGFAVVEFAKVAASARSPLGGVLIEANPLLEKHSELINADCYGEGWMIRLQPDDWMRRLVIW